MADIDDLETTDPFDLPDEADDETLGFSDGHDEADEEADEASAEVGADDAAALRAEVEALKREQEARQIAEHQAQIEAQIEAQHKAREAELAAVERDLSAKRKNALEVGDTDAFEEADAELNAVRLQRAVNQQVKTPNQQPQAEDRVANAAKAWAELNPEFYSDPAFKAKVLKLNEQLTKEGFKVDDPKLYRELDRRLQGGQVKPKSGNVAGVSRGSAVNPNRPASKMTLTESDKRTMRKYQMDPGNPLHRKHWLNRNRIPG